MTPRVAIVDDEPRMAEVLGMVLKRDGYAISLFGRARHFLEEQDREPFDLLLTDLRMPGMDGVELLGQALEADPDLPVILVTAHATVQTAIEAMKRGAFDYICKPFDNDALRALVARALVVTTLSRDNRHLRAQLKGTQGLASIVSASPAMKDVLDIALRAAASRATVLIEGESGTGKEVVARAIHLQSDRVGQPFVAVNCKAFAAGVLESELFGHAKGAFTGAAQARTGVFERAHRGTLLLDEIGETGPDFQAKLLRVLQEREVQRVGDSTVRSVDVRVLAATNRDLLDEVGAGRFREDLYFRLAVVPIRIPPLRHRREDIVPLARLFLGRMCSEQGRRLTGWSPEVEGWLLRHDWPGNVRELENCLERGVVLARGEQIELSDLVLPGAKTGVVGGEGTTTLQQHLDAAATDRIRQALAEADGVRVEAARILGVERTTLYRLIKRYGIDG